MSIKALPTFACILTQVQPRGVAQKLCFYFFRSYEKGTVNIALSLIRVNIRKNQLSHHSVKFFSICSKKFQNYSSFLCDVLRKELKSLLVKFFSQRC